MKNLNNAWFILSGTLQSGKTLLCDKLDQDKFITIDLIKNHYYNNHHSFNKLRKSIGFKLGLEIKDIFINQDNRILDITKLRDSITKEHPTKHAMFKVIDFDWDIKEKDLSNDNFYIIYLVRDPRIDWTIQTIDRNLSDIYMYIREFKHVINRYKKYKDHVHMVRIKTLYEDFPRKDLLNKDFCFGNQTTHFDHSKLHLINEKNVRNNLYILNTELADEIKFLKLEQIYKLEDFLELCEKDKKLIDEYNKKGK